MKFFSSDFSLAAEIATALNVITSNVNFDVEDFARNTNSCDLGQCNEYSNKSYGNQETYYINADTNAEAVYLPEDIAITNESSYTIATNHNITEDGKFRTYIC